MSARQTNLDRGGEVGSRDVPPVARPRFGGASASPRRSPRYHLPRRGGIRTADPYRVLVFTKNATVGAAEGVAALQASAPPEATFDVPGRRRQVHRRGARALQGRRVPQHDRRVARRRPAAAFEKYFKAGGGFLGVGSAIDDRARLGVHDRAARHAQAQRRRGRRRRTIKVADRGHSAGKGLPEYWHAHRPLVQLHRATSAASRTSSRPSTRAPAAGGNTNGAAVAQRRPSGHLVQGLPGRPLLLHRARQHRRELRRARPARRTSAARSQWAAGKADQVYSDCGATVLANYQQTKISRPAEPERADRLRPVPRRAHHPDRARRPGPPARPGHADARRSSPNIPGLHALRGRPLRRARSTTTSPTTSGCTCSTRRRRSGSSSATARSRT